jgi:hypothetical protein
MGLPKVFVASAVMAALALAPASAYAQRRGGRTGGGIVVARRGAAARPAAVQRMIAPRVIDPRVIVTPFRFARPFFAFRPRFGLGLGLWVGFPVAYPYYYSYPYAYSYPYPAYGYPYPYPAYGYPPSPYPAPAYPTSAYPAPAYPTASVGVQPGTAFGGVSFDIMPNTAGVYVDNTYVGTVAEFSPSAQPLTLTPGRHHIEVRAAGYQMMAFDTEIVVGQVTPYRGEMQPLR